MPDPNIPTGPTKAHIYGELDQQLAALLASERNFWANTANTAALLYHSLPGINWAGFYICRGAHLVLGPFQGRPACVRIPLGQGVCGRAAADQACVVVENVEHFPGHIACDPNSRSEIVIPLIRGTRLIGVLDIDSPLANRFDAEDRQGLERLVARLLASTTAPD
jgi:L-methionine (R)-S-oxide reductase